MKANKNELKEALPFLHTLKTIRPSQRAIILPHLDLAAFEKIFHAIITLLKSPRLSRIRQVELMKHLAPHKASLRFIANKAHPKKLRRHKIKQMGGGVMDTILENAIPLMLMEVTKKN